VTARRRPLDSPLGPKAEGGYAQALEVEGARRVLFVSGQIPADAQGRVPSDFASQARLVWANLRAQLEAGGMALDDLVKVTIFLSDRRFADENRVARHEALGDRRVALTVIIAGIFDPAWLLESLTRNEAWKIKLLRSCA
jgi:enamine deaminase RidA (YjgF/YER057c/UK114 family)